MYTREEILNLLRTNRMRIKRLGVKNIGLFGSYARGEHGAKSDIDILVEFEKGQKNFITIWILNSILKNYLTAR